MAQRNWSFWDVTCWHRFGISGADLRRLMAKKHRGRQPTRFLSYVQKLLGDSEGMLSWPHPYDLRNSSRQSNMERTRRGRLHMQQSNDDGDDQETIMALNWIELNWRVIVSSIQTSMSQCGPQSNNNADCDCCFDDKFINSLYHFKCKVWLAYPTLFGSLPLPVSLPSWFSRHEIRAWNNQWSRLSYAYNLGSLA